MPVLAHRISIVNVWELSDNGKKFGDVGLEVLATGVDHDACDLRGQGARIADVAGSRREPRKHVSLRQRDVEIDLALVLVRVEDVAREPVGSPEPTNVVRTPIAWQDTEDDVESWLPLKVRRPRLEPIDVACQRHDREDDVVLGHRHVVDHRGVRSFEPDVLLHLAIGVDDVVGDVRARLTFGGVAKADHVAGDGVDLGVGREGLARDLAAKVGGTEGF